jgi:hypothetical protein
MIIIVPGSVFVELLELDGIIECASLKLINLVISTSDDYSREYLVKQKLDKAAQWMKDNSKSKYGRSIDVNLTFGEAERSVKTSARKA